MWCFSLQSPASLLRQPLKAVIMDKLLQHAALPIHRAETSRSCRHVRSFELAHIDDIIQDFTQSCTMLAFVCTNINVKLRIEHRVLFLVAQLHCLNNIDITMDCFMVASLLVTMLCLDITKQDMYMYRA